MLSELKKIVNTFLAAAGNTTDIEANSFAELLHQEWGNRYLWSVTGLSVLLSLHALGSVACILGVRAFGQGWGGWQILIALLTLGGIYLLSPYLAWGAGVREASKNCDPQFTRMGCMVGAALGAVLCIYLGVTYDTGPRAAFETRMWAIVGFAFVGATIFSVRTGWNCRIIDSHYLLVEIPATAETVNLNIPSTGNRQQLFALVSKPNKGEMKDKPEVHELYKLAEHTNRDYQHDLKNGSLIIFNPKFAPRSAGTTVDVKTTLFNVKASVTNKPAIPRNFVMSAQFASDLRDYIQKQNGQLHIDVSMVQQAVALAANQVEKKADLMQFDIGQKLNELGSFPTRQFTSAKDVVDAVQMVRAYQEEANRLSAFLGEKRKDLEAITSLSTDLLFTFADDVAVEFAGRFVSKFCNLRWVTTRQRAQPKKTKAQPEAFLKPAGLEFQ